jgi:hypothetical protein
MTTTTIEAKTTAQFPTAGPRAERAVFVTEDDSRSRRLRRAAIAAGALSCLWLVGLGIGMLGLGQLPGVSISIPGRGGDQPTRGSDRSTGAGGAQSQSTQQLAAARESAARTAQRRAGNLPTSSQQRQARVAQAAPAPTARIGQSTPVSAMPGNQPAQAVSQPVPRGLARRDLTAPPGQTRRETKPQPPAAPPGQARRVNEQTGTTVEPLPPGQQKLDKPPPPKG